MKKRIVCFYSARSEILKAGNPMREGKRRIRCKSGKSIAAIYISGKIIDRVGKTVKHYLSFIFDLSSTRYLSLALPVGMQFDVHTTDAFHRKTVEPIKF